MATCVERLAEQLASLDREDLRRHRRVLDSPQGARVQLGGRTLLNFSSNDYLGLANDPAIARAMRDGLERFGTGAGASPIVSGHARAHEEAEQRFAAFCGLPRALIFPSGYAANIGILTVLGGLDAEIFGDRLNHACLHDGARLSRSAFTRYGHRDVEELARALAASRAPTRIVATDAVFSMDGDLAPLPELLELCERYDAWLVVDDAHGVGVLGERGRGSLEHFGIASARIVYMATLGKALGGYGAFVAGHEDAIEWIMQRARTYIFSTALPAAIALAAVAALERVERDPELVARLRSRISEFRAACAARGLAPLPSTTAIQPFVLGEPARALEASVRLQAEGFLVPAIRPPTVPQGTARLRVSLSAAHDSGDLEQLADALARCLR